MPAQPRNRRRRFGYGAEFTKQHLDAALDASPCLGVPAYEIERQSQLDEGSHGTHVASTAAGNRGMCSRSPIAGVSSRCPMPTRTAAGRSSTPHGSPTRSTTSSPWPTTWA